MVVQADAGVAFLGVGQAVVAAGAGLVDGLAEGFVDAGLGGCAGGVGDDGGVADGVVEEPFPLSAVGVGGLVGVEDRADAAAEVADRRSAGADDLGDELAFPDFVEVGAAIVAVADDGAALVLAQGDALGAGCGRRRRLRTPRCRRRAC